MPQAPRTGRDECLSERGARFESPLTSWDSSRASTVPEISEQESPIHPIGMDKRNAGSIHGYRVLHSTVRGPRKGASLCSRVSLDEVRALATWMTLEVRGGEYSLRRGQRRSDCDARKMSRGELSVSAALYRGAGELAGAGARRARSDVGTNEQTMAWSWIRIPCTWVKPPPLS